MRLPRSGGLAVVDDLGERERASEWCGRGVDDRRRVARRDGLGSIGAARRFGLGALVLSPELLALPLDAAPAVFLLPHGRRPVPVRAAEALEAEALGAAAAVDIGRAVDFGRPWLDSARVAAVPLLAQRGSLLYLLYI